MRFELILSRLGAVVRYRATLVPNLDCRAYLRTLIGRANEIDAVLDQRCAPRVRATDDQIAL